MKVFVAGATGVIGRQLVPLLRSAGHDVIGMGRRPPAAPETSARMVIADALDRTAVISAVRAAKPDVIVNMLTAIPAQINPRRMAHDFALTNRLRSEGTRNLLVAAADAGVPRVIAQGLAYAYEPAPGLATEDAPLWRDPPRPFAPVVSALIELERQTRAAGGLVLRLGHLYGPGTVYAADGSTVQQVRAGRMPLIGAGASAFSFVHTADVAAAVLAALDSDVTGVVNIVDDDPTPIATWLPALAAMLDAPPPRRLPTVLARIAAGAWGTAFLTRLRGADNALARRTLRWRPDHPSWRAGFATELHTPVLEEKR
jgi:nucleoside-diphosphate-sugar epimerase